ncbi:acyl-CoA thioesterase domain-containing protein [Sphaerisporangium sp. NPDC051011]|uniref:acyl-CoA thioesterase n=1 Tax=Sphaerisporangium sp. NPDC051011 TaxID=3155792 RepID=UPI0033E898AD
MSAEEPTGSPTSETFAAAVTLTPATPQFFDHAWTAVAQDCPWPKAYGGDMVAQAAAAAMLSVGGRDAGKVLHSMHSYFMRPVDIGGEVRYEVEVLRDGRGYSTRQVRGYQNDKVVYVSMAGFAAEAEGGTYRAQMPADIPGPSDLPTSEAYLRERAVSAETSMTQRSKRYWQRGRSFDMRHVPGPVYLRVEGATLPNQAVWIRPFDALRPVPGLTRAQRDLAALAYVCDYTILEPVLRVLGLPWASPGLVTASLDHAMWFHRPLPEGALDGWLLYAQEAVSAAGGRGVGLGRFFTPDGGHLATVVQEGLIRTTDGGSR